MAGIVLRIEGGNLEIVRLPLSGQAAASGQRPQRSRLFAVFGNMTGKA
jgi:hypothetical protein